MAPRNDALLYQLPLQCDLRLLLPSRIYFPTMRVQAGLVTFLDQENVVKWYCVTSKAKPENALQLVERPHREPTPNISQVNEATHECPRPDFTNQHSENTWMRPANARGARGFPSWVQSCDTAIHNKKLVLDAWDKCSDLVHWENLEGMGVASCFCSLFSLVSHRISGTELLKPLKFPKWGE